jgi:hypothetical protein
MNTTNKLIAAAALAVAFAAPVFSAQANVDGETLQLAERNTYAHPAPAGWTANARMASKPHGAMHIRPGVGRAMSARRRRTQASSSSANPPHLAVIVPGPGPGTMVSAHLCTAKRLVFCG